MAEFDDLQAQLAQARAEELGQSHEVFRAREALDRLGRQRAEVLRRGDENDLQAIDGAIAEREEALAGLRAELDGARVGLADLHTRFEDFTDPREHISRLDDRIPICLMPLRLEVRFKSAADLGGDADGDAAGEMWVRAYPDDITVDSFEATLTETEAADARRYWAGVWAAGGVEAQERAAWRTLHAGQGAGRSFWITQVYLPVNPEDRPVPPAERPWIVLAIPIDVPLTDPERAAMRVYWAEIWQAGDDLAVREAAADALAAAVGASRAAELVATTRPINLADPPPGTATRAETEVIVAFLNFPTAEEAGLRQAGWATAPTARLLPDRLVLLGFNGGELELEVLGRRIPDALAVAPDPSAEEADQIAPDGDDLKIPDDIAWLTDFERAVEIGMGFRVPLAAAPFRLGFQELCVLGLRLSADAGAGRAAMEDLIGNHHRSKAGFNIVPQGRPTNNVEAIPSDYSWREDSDVSFDHFFGTPPNDPDGWFVKRDGRWLAQMLGLSPAALSTIPHYGQSDICDAKAMNVALWPATLGYFMESMLNPIFRTATIERTRDFFGRHVTARGTIPAIRVGRQPYGILPVTARSRLSWFSTLVKREAIGRQEGAFLARLHGILRQVDADFAPLLANVRQIGAAGVTDPQQALLDVVGLHPMSVEFQQRYAESLQQLYNRLAMNGAGGAFLAFVIAAAYAASGIQLLERFGYVHDPEGDNPDILDKFFTAGANVLGGGLVDDRPVSETDPLRPQNDSGENYLNWLLTAAQTSHDALRMQEGFAEGVPRALLYHMMHHALDLSFVEVSLSLYLNAGLITADDREALRREPAFLQVSEASFADPALADPALAGGSRWRHLYAREAAITGAPDARIGDFIPQVLATMQATAYLNRQLRALDHLSARPTAALERCLAEHVDLCSYRLDAWYGGLMSRQLEWMRFGDLPPVPRIDTDGDGIPDARDPDAPEAGARTGLYLGAWGWLEDIKPEFRTLTPVDLPPELDKVFHAQDAPRLVEDDENQGYIHAPSLNHAVTAAILRNGYLSNATPGAPDALAINLSSDRVRVALAIIEGMKADQNLAALLGYYFERWLHDRHDVEVDEFIFDLRKAFPIAGNRLRPTRVGATDEAGQKLRINRIEARNVLDGLALVEHLKTSPASYPFGLSDMPVASATQAAAISQEASRLRDIADAVADLAMAEAVHQVAQGNYDRAGAVLDTYSKGKFPQTPDVIRTPRSGVTLSHRVALHLPVGLDPTDPARISPRARTEPALDAWLATVLPDPARVACEVTVRDPAGGPDATHIVSQADLGLAPLDLLYLLDPDSERASRALDDQIEAHVFATHGPRPDVAMTIAYRPRLAAVSDHVPFFELAALIRPLRGLALRSRPLRPTDMALAQEAKDDQDLTQTLDPLRITLGRDTLEAGRDAVAGIAAALGPQFEADPRPDSTIVTEADGRIDAFVAAMLQIAPFAQLESGTGAIFADRGRAYAALQAAFSDHLPRWTERLDAFDAAIQAHDDDPAADAESQIQRLLIAERIIRTTPNAPTPADPAVFRTLLVDTDRVAFEAARDALAAIGAAETTLSGLHDALAAAIPGTLAFLPEAEALDLGGPATLIVTLSEDILRRSTVLEAELTVRLAAVQAKLDQAAADGDARGRIEALTDSAKLLYGKDFTLVPSFTLPRDVATEWRAAWGPGPAASTAILDHQTTTLGRPFPVEDWLTGIARVREKMGDLEAAARLAEAFGTEQLTLQPLQFPNRPDQPWLALDYPATLPDGSDLVIDEDKILFTSLYATPFDETLSQAGLWIDDWTETIPSPTEDTGLAFHYDRPNSEPPQTLLLALPADFTGAWQWRDLVDGVRETMDLARKRAIEPDHIDQTPYTRVLPAIVSAVTLRPLTAALNFSFNNGLAETLASVAPNE